MVKALVFDFDGTIIDTESPEYASWQHVYAAHGAHLPLEVWATCVGTASGTFDPYQYLVEQVGAPIDADAMRLERRKAYLQLVERQPIMPGVMDYLESARAMGLRIGLATSSTREWAEGHLKRLGLRHYFETVMTANDVSEVKPNPELYTKAVAALGVNPHEAIALEDSPNGARAAVRAGLYCVIVPNDLTRDFQFDQYHLRLDSLTELPLGEVIERVRKYGFGRKTDT